MIDPQQSLRKLKNIGQTLERKLAEINIYTQTDLNKVGSVSAYNLLSAKSNSEHLPLCYYLYSLEGAIMGRDWRDLSDQEKAELRLRAGIK